MANFYVADYSYSARQKLGSLMSREIVNYSEKLGTVLSGFEDMDVNDPCLVLKMLERILRLDSRPANAKFYIEQFVDTVKSVVRIDSVPVNYTRTIEDVIEVKKENGSQTQTVPLEFTPLSLAVSRPLFFSIADAILERSDLDPNCTYAGNCPHALNCMGNAAVSYGLLNKLAQRSDFDIEMFKTEVLTLVHNGVKSNDLRTIAEGLKLAKMLQYNPRLDVNSQESADIAIRSGLNQMQRILTRED